MKKINVLLIGIAIGLILSGMILGIRLDFEQIGKTYGYIGIFLMAFISCTSLILPVPYAIPLIAIAAATGLHPLLIGIAGGTGAALGEFSGYILGRSSSEVLTGKIEGRLEWARSFFEKYGFVSIILVNLTPLPVGVLYVAVGMTKYSIKKVLIGGLIGKIILVTGMAYFGDLFREIINEAPKGSWLDIVAIVIGLIVVFLILGGWKWMKNYLTPS